MNYTYEPDDEAESIEARRQLTARFEQTPRGHDLGWVANQVMEFKSGYLDGELSRWRPSEVETILLALYPAQAVLDPADLKRVTAGFSAFLRFLGAEGIAPRGDAVRMAELVERLAPQFHEAAFDVGRWSMGKRLFAQAQSEGVDMSDADALRRFSDEFNQRPFSERDAVLGPIPGSETPALRQPRIEPLPPVALPSTDELESDARTTVQFERLRRLVGFVGTGRPLTDKGNLKLADGKVLVDLLETGDPFDAQFGDQVFKTRSSADLHALDLTFRIAVGSEMLVRHGKKLLSGPNADWVDDPLAAVYGAWLVLLHGIGPTQHFYRSHSYGFDWYAEDLGRSLVYMLVDLYRDGYASIAELVEEEWDGYLFKFDLDDVDDDKLEFHRSLVDEALRRAFDRLGELGTVSVTEVEEIATAYGGFDRRRDRGADAAREVGRTAVRLEDDFCAGRWRPPRVDRGRVAERGVRRP